ncbi:hypothetical protein L596_006552 [Steinernema carpocapsae]|uniref:Uncharacterized protein n=1 Tax=Steinernema carpocapsae TaxID=34508 RepID=A0A4V6I8T6_STECR|nr:hypothetical protein L596_006552 [Steinernema carpocapsae]
MSAIRTPKKRRKMRCLCLFKYKFWNHSLRTACIPHNHYLNCSHPALDLNMDTLRYAFYKVLQNIFIFLVYDNTDIDNV